MTHVYYGSTFRTTSCYLYYKRLKCRHRRRRRRCRCRRRRRRCVCTVNSMYVAISV